MASSVRLNLMLAHNDDKVITPICANRVDFWGAHHKNLTIIVNIPAKKRPGAASLLAPEGLPLWRELKNAFVMSLNF